MNRTFAIASLVAILSLGNVDRSAAQIFTPAFGSSSPEAGIGLYAADGPGDIAVEGIVRRRLSDFTGGLRVGFADTQDLTALIGGDLAIPIGLGAPVDLALTGAGQVALGGASGAGIGAGLIVGAQIPLSDLVLEPFIHPRIAFIDGLRGDGDSTDLLAEAGANLGITPNVDLHLVVGIDDDSAWGFGFSWR